MSALYVGIIYHFMLSLQEAAYPIMQSLDVDYVLVVFGGYANYPSDDINKFLWPVRIASGEASLYFIIRCSSADAHSWMSISHYAAVGARAQSCDDCMPSEFASSRVP